jgi:diguanylate cyclase (GGDEF)-like protein
MSAIPRFGHSTIRALSALSDAVAARRRLWNERLSFSIAAHLVGAFICFGALVLAANFIVEQGVLVEQTTETTRLAPAEIVPRLAVGAAQRSGNAGSRPDAHRSLAASDALTLALDRFGDAARGRIEINSGESEAEFQHSAAELRRASDACFAQSASFCSQSLASFIDRLNAYTKAGYELVEMADDHHVLMVQYSTHYEAIYARTSKSLKGAWKVFGRILARPSLLQLSADLDELRRSSAAMSTAFSADDPELESLLQAEAAVSNDLQVNEKALQHSEGNAWYTAISDDFAQLVSLRDSILQSNAQLHARAREYSVETTNLTTLIRSKIGAALAVTVPNADGGVHLSGGARASGADAVSPSAAVRPRATVVETISKTIQVPQDHRRQTLTWLSMVALTLLGLLALGAVLSIVRPVRRLHEATKRLASGDSAVRVPRGGIKELDTLAVAFNVMTEELAAAKSAACEYQQGLEAKVTERTHQLRELAQCDPLTGLPNRREFFSMINAVIERAQRDKCLVGLYFLDVDNFKYLNDSLGHAFGDRVLISLACRLKAATGGFGFAARLGGDEFTVVCDGAENADDIQSIGLRLVEAFQRPLSVDGRDLIVGVSVGASIYPEHGQDAEGLLTAADIALFRAKALGRSQLSMFTPDLLQAAAAKFKTEQGLRHAIDRGEFELVFQPEVSTGTLQTVLVEALIRWRMSDGSLATADTFLGVAEESGLILEIGEWVLRSAIEAVSEWHHGDWPDARVAINVSARQLLDSRFAGLLYELLQHYRVPPHCVEIELTESILQTGSTTIAALGSLRDHGIAIALDDFGTGYSSFSSLEQLPLTRVKLDRSLVAGIDRNPRSAAIARAIIAMCRELGLQTTAEGVERVEQFSWLVNQPAMYLQGYLLGMPVCRERLLQARSEVAQRAQELLLVAPASRSSVVARRAQSSELELTEVG